MIVPVADETGRVFRLYGTVQDITERRRLETERLGIWNAWRLSRHLVEIEERERRELASALHDRASPNLAALQILSPVSPKPCPNPSAAKARPLLEDASALLADTTAGIREICTNPRPATLDYSGLVPALREYVAQFRARTGLDVCIDADPGNAPQVPPERPRPLCFRLVQEA